MKHSRTFGLLFPGQGSELPGMSQGWDGFKAWQETLQEAEERRGYALRLWMAEGPLDSLRAQRHAPYAVVAHSVGIYRACRAEGMPLPSVGLGHSLGFYSAMVASGVLPLGAALDIVDGVEDVCEACFGNETHGMAFFIGLTEMEIREALAAFDDLVLSNFNGKAQFTVSGALPELEALESQLRPRCLKSGLLPVKHPLHGIHMVPLLPELTRRLGAWQPGEPDFPLVSHGNGRLLRTGREIWDEAIVSVAMPVCWPRAFRCVQGLAEHAYECGPGKQLQNLCRWVDRDFNVSLAEAMLGA